MYDQYTYWDHTHPPHLPSPPHLMVWLEGPVLSDDGVTEVADLPEHGLHEGGAQVGCVILVLLAVLDYVLC